MKLVYNQTISYKITSGSDLQPLDVVTRPFASQITRDAFALLLWDSNDTAFISIDLVTAVTQEGTSATTVPLSTVKSIPASVTDGAAIVTTTPSSGNLNECTIQTTVLNADDTLQTEFDNMISAIEDDVTSNFLRVCNLGTKCEIDAKEFSSDFESTCVAAKGQVTTRSVSFGCTGNVGGIPIPEGLETSIIIWPICIGDSCNPNALPQDVETEIDTAINSVVEEIEAGLGGDVTCESLAGSDGAPTIAPPSENSPYPLTTAPVDATETTKAPVMPPTVSPLTSSAWTHCSPKVVATVISAAAALVIGM